MTQLEGLTVLVDAARNALAATNAETVMDLARIAQANPQRFIEAGRCPTCGFISPECQCWDAVNSTN